MSYRIYRVTDRIPLKIHDLEVTISPLTRMQKIDVELSATGDNLVKAGLNAASLAIKYAVKDVKGLKDADGTDYKLSLDPNGVLTDECVDDLMNMQFNAELGAVCMALLEKVPDKFVNPITGKPIEGVEFVKESNSEKKDMLSGQ